MRKVCTYFPCAPLTTFYSVQTTKNWHIWPVIWRVLFPTTFSASLEKAGPKHSISVPFSVGVAVPLSVDVKEVALVPNPVPVVTVKGLVDPQGRGSCIVVCGRRHPLLPPTLQWVTPFMSPVTVQLKVKVSPKQLGRTATNCPATSPEVKEIGPFLFLLWNGLSQLLCPSEAIAENIPMQ